MNVTPPYGKEMKRNKQTVIFVILPVIFRIPTMSKQKLPFRFRLILPVSLIIVVVVTFITVWFVSSSVRNYRAQIEKYLEQEVETLVQMFEREAQLKLQSVRKNMNVARSAFNSKQLEISPEVVYTDVTNQETGRIHTTGLKTWKLDGKILNNRHVFVDSLKELIGGTITVFQRIDSGFVRISTNVLKSDGERATGTFIPNNSPVAQAVLKGKPFLGRAFIPDEWYMTSYEPVFENREIIGMIYVGDKEKDLDELEKILNSIDIGKDGYPFVFDNNGYLIIHPYRKGEFWGDSLLFQQVSSEKHGLINYAVQGRKKIMAFRYFEKFEFYIAAAVYYDAELYELKRDAILGASITAILSIAFLLGFLYYFTTERLNKFFSELQMSRKKLFTVSKALEESEERFRKLFDSTGDDIFVTDIEENIVEVNNSVCESLGYSRDELLAMKMSDIKSAKYKQQVAENRKIIYEKGSHTFESEHATKNGNIIQVEFTSRLVSYGDEQLILSVVRNISQRRELERQILSAVIRGEERERQRFAREMHDGLGPLLSTVKLYVNELASANMTEEERKDLIRHSNEMLDDAVNSARTISNNLMPTVIQSYGLVKAVQAFCDKVNKTNKINIQFETENIEERLEENLELILFRVISELINNTLKHAQAENVFILLIMHEDRLSLNFRDDGVGFDAEEILQSDNKGMGLKNIISRVKSINGNYSFSSRQGEGFTIKIEINN
jgi:PAS domain S-box-containing protein